MEQIKRLLTQAEQDINYASDEAMRLTVEFGNDALLREFVATANQLKFETRDLRARSQATSQQAESPTRNTNIQFLLMRANDLRTRAARFKETVMEIARND